MRYLGNLFLLVYLVLLTNLNASDMNFFQYIFPKPGSVHISTETTIFFRLYHDMHKYLDISDVKINIEGEKSGFHTGETFFADDIKTVIFKPFQMFEVNEKVYVEISIDLNGIDISKRYYFSTSDFELDDHQHRYQQGKNLELRKSISQDKTYGKMSVINGVSVPADFPKVEVDILDTTAPGKIFLATWLEYPDPYIMILNNDGTPYYYKRLQERSLDFKVQPKGTLTRWEGESLDAYIEIDSDYEVIDTLFCGHGYITDMHDVQVLPNDNYLIIAEVFETIDMSQLIPGGNSNALVRGSHVLEMDRNDNVVFEWQCWDHFDILDVIDQNLTSNSIDFVHMNAIAVDYDGQLLISSRSLSEVTKINRQTGEIIWRLGGKKNQFEFVNDEYGISRQHDIRPVPNKDNHYTLFDNGTYHNPQFSRAVEFVLDTTKMTATNVWEYRSDPDRYTTRAGNVQRLPNGNTLINWVNGSLPKVSEVTPDGEVVYEMNFESAADSYRSFRFDWSGISKKPYLILENYDNRVSLIFNKFGDPDVMDYIIYAGLEPNPQTAVDTTSQTWIDLTDFKYNDRYFFRVTARNHAGEESGFSNEENILINFINPGDNMILNGDFSDGDFFWELDVSGIANATGDVEEGVYNLIIDTSGTSELNVQLKQGEISLVQGKKYILEFDAYADNPRTIEVSLEKAISPFTIYSLIGFIVIDTTMKHYSKDIEMIDPSDFEAQLVFNCGHEDPDLHFDNISLKEDITSAIENENKRAPEKYNLFQNYPNPFNPKTIINYELPITNLVDLSIYNLRGQKVMTLVSEKQKAGFHEVEWNASGFASGVYYYRLTAEAGFVQTKKLILLK